MARFRELRQAEMQEFLQAFSLPGTLKYRNNKWVGLNRDGRPFTVHVKHGSTRKFPPQLVEAVAKDLGVSPEEFLSWYDGIEGME
jgi:hypothetical protein